MHIAHPLPRTPQGYDGRRWGYRLSEPYRHTDYNGEIYDYHYVVVSSGVEAVQAFPASDSGKIIDWAELHTAPLGTEPEIVMAAMGYEVER